MRLYLIRHGETDWNKELKMQGRADIPLNEYGRSLAVQTAQALSDVCFDRVYTSPLVRAKETAEIIKANRSIPLVEDERIIEIGFGEYEGEGLYEDPKHTKLNPAFVHFFSAPALYQADKGSETFREVVERTNAFLTELKSNEDLRNQTILVSTHGAALCAMLLNLKKRPLEQFWDGGVHKNCAVTVVDMEKENYEILQEAVVYYEENEVV